MSDNLLREALLLKLKDLQEKQRNDPENREAYSREIDEILIKLRDNN